MKKTWFYYGFSDRRRGIWTTGTFFGTTEELFKNGDFLRTFAQSYSISFYYELTPEGEKIKLEFTGDQLYKFRTA
ncbi:MAG: hypothetical protein ACI9AR_000026 [Flavobacteriaceae bacterium]|jgi:hypothetical protein